MILTITTGLGVVSIFIIASMRTRMPSPRLTATAEFTPDAPASGDDIGMCTRRSRRCPQDALNRWRTRLSSSARRLRPTR
jgi:hypothetical protein